MVEPDDAPLSPEEFELSAEEAFRRMSPLERLRFAYLLREQARSHAIPLPELLAQEPLDERLRDPHVVARLLCELHEAHPSLLPVLLGNAGFGGLRARLSPLPSERTVLGHPATRLVLLGLAALALRHWLRARTTANAFRPFPGAPRRGPGTLRGLRRKGLA